MSYYNDNNKYGDFFDKYNPNRYERQKTPINHKHPKNRKKRHLKGWVKALFTIIVFIIITAIITMSVTHCDGDNSLSSSTAVITSSVVSVADENQNNSIPTSTNYTKTLSSEIESNSAILVDTSDNTILAQKYSDRKIYPASMTKVMTLLCVAENIKDLTETFKMTSKIIDPLYKQEATLAGFCPNESVIIEDMIYGMVLESGAEASVGLAIHISGSEENFVKLMNEKANSLGLKSTHFTNVSGLHNNNHYTTCKEMAIIMNAAINNSFCRKVLSTEYYTVKANDFHEEIKFHSGMFSRMYGNEPGVAQIIGGKTGYTMNSGNCLVSFATTDDNRDVICVTAEGGGKYIPIYDCIKLYKEYSHSNKEQIK